MLFIDVCCERPALYGNVTFVCEGMRYAIVAFEQEGIFIVPCLCCDTGV